MHRVVVVDDHRLIRESLSALLRDMADLDVVGTAADGEEALRMVDDLGPDLVLMDLSMPRMDGIEATRRLKESGAEVTVVILTFLSQRHLVLEALDAGADGYLVKDQRVSEILAGVRLALAGGHPVPVVHTDR